MFYPDLAPSSGEERLYHLSVALWWLSKNKLHFQDFQVFRNNNKWNLNICLNTAAVIIDSGLLEEEENILASMEGDSHPP